MTSLPPYTVQSVEFDTSSGLLHANLSTGKRMPVYLYGPLNYDRKIGKVKWIDKWPDYAAAYAVNYSPLPALPQPQMGFGSQSRDSAIYPWVQATYQGYPLYIYGDGTQDDPASEAPPVAKRHMFQRATKVLPLLQLEDGDEPGSGDPIPTSGP